MADTMPVLFVSHGPPTLLLMDSPVTESFKTLCRHIPDPECILCISAHWEARTPTVTGNEIPQLIYDFGGPPRLFDETYPATGSPELADRVVTMLAKQGIRAEQNDRRGLDHGVWVPLKLMFPDADIPVVQLSVQTDMDARHHYDLGCAVKPLREEGVLIVGSGGAVHNLYEIQDYAIDDTPADYARAFDRWLYDAVTGGHHDQVINFRAAAPDPERSHPFPAEHFLPLLVSLGAAGEGRKGTLIHDGFMYGTLSMASYLWF